MNMILLMSGYPEAIIRKRDRMAYIDSLEKTQTGGSMDTYMKIVAQAVNRSLEIYLRAAEGKTDTGKEKGPLLRIGEIAKLANQRNSTIRHWTKEGLLEIAEITDAGYKLYTQEMVERIRLINELKSRRLTLREIRKKILRDSPD